MQRQGERTRKNTNTEDEQKHIDESARKIKDEQKTKDKSKRKKTPDNTSATARQDKTTKRHEKT